MHIVDGDHEMVESGGVNGVGVGSVDQLEGDELVVGQLQHRQRAEPALRHAADHFIAHRAVEGDRARRVGDPEPHVERAHRQCRTS